MESAFETCDLYFIVALVSFFDVFLDISSSEARLANNQSVTANKSKHVNSLIKPFLLFI